jgi:hypothetical protein
MLRVGRIRSPSVVLAAGVVALAFAATAAGAQVPMSLLYDDDSDGSVTAIVRGGQGQPGLGWERGAFRQEKSVDHLLAGDADRANRMGKLGWRELEGKTAAEIAALFRRHIDSSCIPDNGCTSHLVAVDEIGNAFADERGDLGTRLSHAMAALDELPWPGGGSYADRVHFYIAPAIVTAVGYGLGPDHNLGRDGVKHRNTWSGVLPGLARGGGVWLEMYRPGNNTGPVTGLERRAWESGPRDLAQLLVRSGGSLDRVHLLMSNPGLPPQLPTGTAAADFCPTMACQWDRATDPNTLNPRLVANGVGQYQLSSAALGADWLARLNAAEASPTSLPSDAVILARFREPILSAPPALAAVRRIGGVKRIAGSRLAITLQVRQTVRLTFVAAGYRVLRRVVKGTRRVNLPMPRCNGCRSIRVRVLLAGKDQRISFAVAPLPADRPRSSTRPLSGS